MSDDSFSDFLSEGSKKPTKPKKATSTRTRSPSNNKAFQDNLLNILEALKPQKRTKVTTKLLIERLKTKNSSFARWVLKPSIREAEIDQLLNIIYELEDELNE